MSEMLRKLVAAVDQDLSRQAAVQRGVQYTPSDECGVAAANMNIVVAEVVRAVLQAMRTPTEAMMGAGRYELTYGGGADATTVWRDMIDAALEDPRHG